MKQSQASAPGKLILTGEHAVVYGQPAIALTVSKHATAKISFNQDERIDICLQKTLYSCPLTAFLQKTNAIDERFKAYQAKQLSISDVLEHPAELILLLIQKLLKNKPPQDGLSINIQIDFPIGSGMGASAAVITACQAALCDFYDLQYTNLERYQSALEIEHYQHGTSSGLDILLSLNGGMLELAGKHTSPLTVNCDHLWAIHTGKPASSTGDCVDHVRQHFESDFALWQAFAACSQTIKSALIQQDLSKLQQGFKQNHRLLCKLGVVPNTIQTLISEIESAGLAAKISGAGSIKSGAAGMVLVACKQPQLLEKLCKSYQYPYFTITLEPNGAHCL